MTKNVPDGWQITDVGNIDALRSSLQKTRTPTGWTARECSPILLNGIAAMDGSDCFWARSISRQAHKSARDAGSVPVLLAARRSRQSHIVV
jgi:TPP-dependent pyruvate/acetoin dehydrogenase alpha subunit